jgi:hypothetical protein
MIYENSTPELCVLDEAYGTGSRIADVVNWGYPVLSEPGFLILYEWTHPARTGPIGDNCTPSPPRRYTHSNRQRLVVCEGKLRWMSLYKWSLRELSSPFRVQGGRRGDRTTQVIFRHQSLEIAIYLCVLQPLEADVYLCVSCACFSNLKLTYTCACPRGKSCVLCNEICVWCKNNIYIFIA